MKCSFEAGVFFCGEQAVLCGGRGEIASKNQPRMVLKPINGVRPAGNFPDQEGTITCPNDCPPADVMRDGVNRRRVCHNGAVLHRAVAFYGLHWVEELLAFRLMAQAECCYSRTPAYIRSTGYQW